ncbi:MAG: VWA domain-containing protein [Polyangiaceae bacterium]|nr:VWA domain-containing protein [Polyangiaceae bacterium]
MWSRILACAVGAVVLACSAGSGSPSSSSSNSNSNGSGGSGSKPDGTGATGNTSSTLRDSGADDVDDLSDGEACAENAVGAHTTQVNLVFVYDKSGSMGDDTKTDAEGYPRWENMELRWNPAKEALIAFFEDPGAPELYASIKFFPHAGGYDATCSLDNYIKPDVGLTSLTDNPQKLIDALNKTTPGGGTPTLPAMMGAVDYATKLMTETYPESQSIIILVTDGEPVVVDETGAERHDSCPGNSTNDIESIAAVARAAYNRPEDTRIPTYVVGIGVSQDDMAQIAEAGGTTLIYIAGDNGDDTKAKLLEALQLIQETYISCVIPIPDPGLGETIDFEKVNVDFVDSN